LSALPPGSPAVPPPGSPPPVLPDDFAARFLCLRADFLLLSGAGVSAAFAPVTRMLLSDSDRGVVSADMAGIATAMAIVAVPDKSANKSLFIVALLDRIFATRNCVKGFNPFARMFV
jgi:hypothetical protein